MEDSAPPPPLTPKTVGIKHMTPVEKPLDP
jgi:hypothetical protein